MSRIYKVKGPNSFRESTKYLLYLSDTIYFSYLIYYHYYYYYYYFYYYYLIAADPYVHPSITNIQDKTDQDLETNKISIDLTEKGDQNDKITSPPSEITNSIPNSEYHATLNKKASDLGLNTILLIICSNRPQYLKRTLDAVLKYHPRYIHSDNQHQVIFIYI